MFISEGKQRSMQCVHVLTYFWMLRSIKGYFTRRLLGESAKKKRRRVSQCIKLNEFLFYRIKIKKANMFNMRTTRLPFKVLLILCRFEVIGFHRKAKCWAP